MDEKIVVQFWGVRGTLPVSGKQNVRYGGNTSCITLNFKKHFFIFDAGTGIKSLSTYLEQQGKKPISAKIFISHSHHDHINGFPFFAPLYSKDNRFEIFGTPHGDVDIKQILSQQMNSIYFPITLRELLATLTFRNLSEETFEIDDVTVKTIFLNHPGRCLGYRIQYQNKSFCYITDNELPLENSPDFNPNDVDKLIQFIHGADIVVMDTTYSDKEYLCKIHWGHSSVSRVIDIVDAAKVKLVCLFHHDPDQTDKEIDEKLAYAKALLKKRRSKTKCIAPSDGDKLYI